MSVNVLVIRIAYQLNKGRIMKKIIFSLSLFCLLTGCTYNVTSTGSHPLPSWKIQLNEGKVSFRGLCAVSNDVVWASGSSGTFARSIDGGKNWLVSKVPGAENIDFRDIQAFDENTAIVFGIESPAKFYKTADGGKNWKLVYLNDNNDLFFSAACFRNQKEGFALSDPVGDRFFIVTTADGGETWQQIPQENCPKAVEGEGIFAASGSNIAMPSENKIIFVTGCTAARVFISSDNGKTWSFVNSSLESGSGSNGIFSIAMKNERDGVIVGGDYKKFDDTTTNAAVTTDGGKTWSLIENNKPSGFRESVIYKPGTNIVITIGPSGCDISYDGGKSWVRLGSDGFHVAAFSPDGKSCWSAGGKGQISILSWPAK